MSLEHGSAWPDLSRLALLAEVYDLRLHVTPAPAVDGSYYFLWAKIPQLDTWQYLRERDGFAMNFTTRMVLASLELHRRQGGISRTALARRLGTSVKTIRESLTAEIDPEQVTANEPLRRHGNARTTFAIAAALNVELTVNDEPWTG